MLQIQQILEIKKFLCVPKAQITFDSWGVEWVS